MNVSGNYYDKYHTKNPLARYLMNGFFSGFDHCLNNVEVNSVLEAGCGEGELTNFIHNKFWDASSKFHLDNCCIIDF